MRFEQRNQFGLDGKETLQREERNHGVQQIRNDELFLAITAVLGCVRSWESKRSSTESPAAISRTQGERAASKRV